VTEEEPVVYVVDDDPSVRKTLERLLRSAGHEAKTFASAIEFLDFTYPDTPGCLILDIKMPTLSGLELQDRLVEKGISFPIIFITGHGTIPSSVRAFKAGLWISSKNPSKTGNSWTRFLAESKSTAACDKSRMKGKCFVQGWIRSPHGNARFSGSWCVVC
jgi:DNA-binding NtrC family response regulator